MTLSESSARAASAPAPASRNRLVLGFLVIYVVWGSTYLAIRWGVETIPPFVMGGVRFLIAGGLLYGFSRWRGAAAPSAIEWRNSAIIGFLLLFVGNGAVSWSEQRVSSGMTSLMVATVPLWLVLCEVAQGKRPGFAKWAGVALGLVGVALLVLPADGQISSAAVAPSGAIVLACGSLSWTIGSLYSRTARLAKPAALAISMQMLAGGVMLMVLSVVSGELSHVHRDAITLASVYSLAYLIVFGSLIGFSTYMWLLRVASPTAVGTYAYVNPVVAVLLGVALAGERMPPQALLAMLVIVGGVAMVSLGGQFGGRRAART
ncbi:MAG: drug/metabolite exporter YedA [Gemmatimonadaceae bacterium]|nr:drug/metabolite exporter YedA [Gemmatimonadaceae bacterium]